MFFFDKLRKFFRKAVQWIDVKIVRIYIDQRFWKFENWPTEKYREHYHVNREDLRKFYPAVNPDVAFEELDIFGKHLVDIHSEYLYRYPFPTLLEPRHFLLINRQDGKIIERSRSGQFDPWGADMTTKPSTISYLLPKDTLKVDRVVVVSRSMWFNYYHFFFDALTQIVQLDKYGIDGEISIVVPEAIKDIAYINEFIELSNFLQNRRFVYLKPSQYLEISQEAIVVRDSSIHAETISTILKSIDWSLIPDLNEVPSFVFLTRNSKRLRSIQNSNEIEEIARRNGFVVIDTEKWSLYEQIAFFRKAKNVVGIHGAGLTNTIFANEGQLKLLEIMPGDLNAAFYEHICLVRSHEYARIKGGAINSESQFPLAPSSFEQMLQNYFNIKGA